MWNTESAANFLHFINHPVCQFEGSLGLGGSVVRVLVLRETTGRLTLLLPPPSLVNYAVIHVITKANKPPNAVCLLVLRLTDVISSFLTCN